VKNRFQSLPFKCNLHRYTKATAAVNALERRKSEVGLCRVNQG
jgi:hypothetical protein